MSRILLAIRSVLSAVLFVVGATAMVLGQQYESLYSFQGPGMDGSGPTGPLVADKYGNLYGTTTYGGSATSCAPFGCGTAFQLQPPATPGDPWTETILHNFGFGTDGAMPSSGRLAVDKSGNVYGTTLSGGSASFPYGTVFQLTPPPTPGGAWTETVLYNFTCGNDGGVPNGLVIDAAGILYGTTDDCGQYGLQQGVGTIFQLSPPKVPGGAWTERTLFSFHQIKDGNEPSDLTMDAKGNLYGTRSADNFLCTPSSPKACGMAFELQRGTNWRMKLLHQFQGSSDGSSPWSGMILDGNGNLYGTTIGFGGNITSAGGTVFELSPPAGGTGPWTETLLYTFTGGTDGAQPTADAIFDRSGNLYGTTFYGGELGCNLGLGCGVVFKLAPPAQQGMPWTESVLHTFQVGSDGQNPLDALIWGKGGDLYGTASSGGGSSNCTSGCGTVFRVAP